MKKNSLYRTSLVEEISEHPPRYGFKIDPAHLYQQEPLRYVEVDETVKSHVQFAKERGTNYKLLKHHNPWLRDDQLTVRKGRKYRIAIPA